MNNLSKNKEKVDKREGKKGLKSLPIANVMPVLM